MMFDSVQPSDPWWVVTSTPPTISEEEAGEDNDDEDEEEEEEHEEEVSQYALSLFLPSFCSLCNLNTCIGGE